MIRTRAGGVPPHGDAVPFGVLSLLAFVGHPLPRGCDGETDAESPAPVNVGIIAKVAEDLNAVE